MKCSRVAWSLLMAALGGAVVALGSADGRSGLAAEVGCQPPACADDSGYYSRFQGAANWRENYEGDGSLPWANPEGEAASTEAAAAPAANVEGTEADCAQYGYESVCPQAKYTGDCTVPALVPADGEITGTEIYGPENTADPALVQGNNDQGDQEQNVNDESADGFQTSDTDEQSMEEYRFNGEHADGDEGEAFHAVAAEDAAAEEANVPAEGMTDDQGFGEGAAGEAQPDDAFGRSDTDAQLEGMDSPSEDTEEPAEDTEEPAEDTEEPAEDTEEPAEDMEETPAGTFGNDFGNDTDEAMDSEEQEESADLGDENDQSADQRAEPAEENAEPQEDQEAEGQTESEEEVEIENDDRSSEDANQMNPAGEDSDPEENTLTEAVPQAEGEQAESADEDANRYDYAEPQARYGCGKGLEAGLTEDLGAESAPSADHDGAGHQADLRYEYEYSCPRDKYGYWGDPAAESGSDDDPVATDEAGTTEQPDEAQPTCEDETPQYEYDYTYDDFRPDQPDFAPIGRGESCDESESFEQSESDFGQGNIDQGGFGGYEGYRGHQGYDESEYEMPQSQEELQSPLEGGESFEGGEQECYEAADGPQPADGDQPHFADMASEFDLFAFSPSELLGESDQALLRTLAKQLDEPAETRRAALNDHLEREGLPLIEFANRFEDASGTEVLNLVDDLPALAALLATYRLVERDEVGVGEGVDVLQRAFENLTEEWISEVDEISTEEGDETISTETPAEDSAGGDLAQPGLLGIVRTWLADSLVEAGGAFRCVAAQVALADCAILRHSNWQRRFWCSTNSSWEQPEF